MYRYDQGSWSLIIPINSIVKDERMYAMDMDQIGRPWIATNYGLMVYDGRQWRSYRTDNSDIPSTIITEVAVIGNGPPLPDLREKQAGGISFLKLFERQTMEKHHHHGVR